ncbi:MAG: hypothetical protein JXR96_16980 [Deltaproteobacteria bacterium]|nr:hypothetical protein [Deltaproteobacteria bacterium]
MHFVLSRALLLCPVMAFAIQALAGDDGPAIGIDAARDLLFEALPDDKAVAACLGEESGSEEPGARIRCLIGKRYSGDRKAARLALKLYDRTGGLAGLLPAQDFDGDWRGHIALVPNLPIGKDRKHLTFVTGALLEMDAFFAALEKHAGRPVSYRWRNLGFRFFRSVRRRTPAAFAHGWTIGYNVRGTLNYSTHRVCELLFHEIFHLNDHAHGDWSARALGDIHAQIAKRCGSKVACLTPYAPGWLKVRGRTYYAFMPGHGPEEYAAELSINYLREQRAIQTGKKVRQPFKCGPELNARAWRLLADEFFAGVDLVPDCPKKKPR